MPEIQYIQQAIEGDFVTFDGKRHKIIFNGEPHIQYRENGKRVRKYLREFLFEYGSIGDYVFNGWFKIYKDYETFKTFAEYEKNIIDN